MPTVAYVTGYHADPANALDADLAKYDASLDAGLNVELSRRDRTNIALRTSAGVELLVSLMDCGDHVSIDLTAYSAAGGEEVEAFTMSNGRGSARIEGALLVAMVRKDDEREREDRLRELAAASSRNMQADELTKVDPLAPIRELIDTDPLADFRGPDGELGNDYRDGDEVDRAERAAVEAAEREERDAEVDELGDEALATYLAHGMTSAGMSTMDLRAACHAAQRQGDKHAERALTATIEAREAREGSA